MATVVEHSSYKINAIDTYVNVQSLLIHLDFLLKLSPFECNFRASLLLGHYRILLFINNRVCNCRPGCRRQLRNFRCWGTAAVKRQRSIRQPSLPQRGHLPSIRRWSISDFSTHFALFPSKAWSSGRLEGCPLKFLLLRTDWIWIIVVGSHSIISSLRDVDLEELKDYIVAFCSFPSSDFHWPKSSIWLLISSHFVEKDR